MGNEEWQLTERDERVVEYIGGERELEGDLLGGVLAGLEEGEHCVPHGALSDDGVDQCSGVEVLDAEDDSDRVGPPVELG